MSEKFLTIERKTDGMDEWFVMGKDNAMMGQIADAELFGKRQKLSFYDDSLGEWTSDCLRQIADELDRLNGPIPTGGTNSE